MEINDKGNEMLLKFEVKYYINDEFVYSKYKHVDSDRITEGRHHLKSWAKSSMKGLLKKIYPMLDIMHKQG